MVTDPYGLGGIRSARPPYPCTDDASTRCARTTRKAALRADRGLGGSGFAVVRICETGLRADIAGAGSRRSRHSPVRGAAKRLLRIGTVAGGTALSPAARAAVGNREGGKRTTDYLPRRHTPVALDHRRRRHRAVPRQQGGGGSLD